MTENRFAEQFIEDYFAESEEHLANVRRALLELDTHVGQLAPANVVQSLARALHTLKGLSGMVGLSVAEQVAHAMEERSKALADLRNVDAAVVQDLFEGAALLETCVSARRAHAAAPDIESYVLRMAAYAPEGAVASAVVAPVTMSDVRDTVFTFVPSAATIARGIGVETIRTRLQSLGTIVQATPRVVGAGRVHFDFVVTVRDDHAPPAEWRADGLEWDDAVFARHRTGALVPATRRADAPVSEAVASNAVRVDLARLDDIMRMLGDLVISRARLDGMLDTMAAPTASQLDELRDVNTLIERQLRTLREGVTRIRLVPVGEVFERLRFAIREVAREAAKTIALDLQGQDTEIDKLVVDRMLEPLLHLVRNAASHGIETSEQREALGKPAEGRISLRARAEGNRIFLEVEDDGAGIDIARVADRARAVGLLPETAELDDRDLLEVLCHPGFSTRQSSDMASGRGVGMAVVRSAVRGLGGELTVYTAVGRGTRWVIELPLTLMIADALLFDVGQQSLAVPQLVLREILELDAGAVRRIENNEVVPYRENVLPLVRLARVFNIRAPEPERGYVLVVGTDSALAGLVVDRIVGLREIVVHPVSDPLVARPGIAGATELPDGRVSLIIDAAAIARRGREESQRARPVAAIRARAMQLEASR